MKNKTNYLLLGFTAFAVLLIVGRCFFSGKFHFLFLGWNLFLAWLPVLFANLFQREKNEKQRLVLLMFWAMCWLLFLPNAPYVLTDLFHLKKMAGVPFWVDWLLLLTCGWVSLLLGFLSIRIMFRAMKTFLKPRTIFIAECFVFLLCAYGVYLGRFRRFNSWDILSDPFALLHDIGHSLVQPRAVAITFLYGLFLMLVWQSIRLFQSEEHETARK